MGTNYYLRNIKTKEELHLGKKSAGWQFCFKVNEEYQPNLKSLIEYISNSDFEIIAEGEKISVLDFQKVIKDSIFGYNFKTYHYNLDSELHNYISATDFIANDGSWWCNSNFS